MDSVATLVLNIVTIITSLTALILSTIIALRQAQYARQASHVPIMMEIIREFHSGNFMEDLQYVSTGLSVDNPKPVAISKLPSPAREKAVRIAIYFQGLGTSVALGIVDGDIIERALSRQVIVSWLALEPYVVEERKRKMAAISGFRYFEDLAVGSTQRWLSANRGDLPLRTFDFDMNIRRKLTH